MDVISLVGHITRRQRLEGLSLLAEIIGSICCSEQDKRYHKEKDNFKDIHFP